MRFLLVTNVRDGKGLAVDAEILSARLADLGHEAVAVDYRDHGHERADIAVHLEVVEPHYFAAAGRHWYVPNAEWHCGAAPMALNSGRFEHVLCKTAHAHELFSKLTDRASFLGFESRDRMDASVERERRFLHVAGGSIIRGTEAVEAAFVGAAPPLVRPRRVPDDELRALQNGCAFHVLPSEYEGWGHTLHEALSVGAVLITTDAPPMSETAAARLVPPVSFEPCRLVRRAKVDAAGVRDAVRWAVALSDHEVRTIGEGARAAFEAERDGFRERLRALVEAAA